MSIHQRFESYVSNVLVDAVCVSSYEVAFSRKIDKAPKATVRIEVRKPDQKLKEQEYWQEELESYGLKVFCTRTLSTPQTQIRFVVLPGDNVEQQVGFEY